MASSQVEIASSAPFGCVLRDHNRRDRCRSESNARATQTAFQKNFKNLVRNHLQTCISISSGSSSSENQINNNSDSNWIGNNEETDNNNNNGNDCPPIMSSRQAWIQAKEVVPTTIETSSAASSPGPSTSRIEDNNVLTRSDSLSEISSLGASSLVQIWEKRLNKSHSMNSRTASRCDSATSCCNENASSSSSAASSVDESIDVGPASEDSFSAWNSDRNNSLNEQQPSPPPPQEQSLDAGESERVRVADIIRRLTAANQTQSSLSSSLSDDNDNEHYSSTNASPSREHERLSTSDQIENRSFTPVLWSPRIRGRQAFTDLLMQIERDRLGELDKLADRRAVSRFSQRGRIQIATTWYFNSNRQQRRPQTTPSQVDRLPQGSTIVHLRERFNNGVEQGATAESDEANPRSPQRDIANNTTQLENSSIPSTPNESTHNHEVNCNDQQQSEISVQNNPLAYASEDLHQHNSNIPSSDVAHQGMSSETRNLDSQEITNVTAFLDGWDVNDAVEEFQDNYQQYTETNLDWISDISRPRSYWEGRRQEWYQEMLTLSSDNEEICQLLQRRTVSNFLTSDFRDRIDRLMVSRLDRQQHPAANQEEGDEYNQEHLMAFLQRHAHQAESQLQQELEEEEEEQIAEDEEHDEEEEDEEEEEEDSQVSGQYHEGSDYINQSTSSSLQLIPSSPLVRSWSYQENEVGEESDRATSTSPILQNLPSQPYCQNTLQCSPSVTISSSIEMELICDLRRHMEHLYQEMSELRKSIKSCMDMQMMVHQSIQHDVHNPVRREGKIYDGTPKKGNCCICYEMKVDSLLYRCGHMCTCLKCAHELQWSSGKCPVCRAPIVDVVRAYMES
ncbi:hypothetical protein FNV43_RR06181 [Rhamnella rubrinervis]|uniref:RING-type domain-containing protein n=1 Tax=Rhamnella rubrinervis TaxID=2594499 RepID=A0A8K0HCZ1_9ROSA|nr:hypothetical protein FNV43_RR06181 [Rhamnella rubrinervis]